MQPQSAALKLAVGMMVKAEKPDAIVCDVNETLFSLEPFRKRLQAVGLPEWSLELWFASCLRDGIALAASGGFATFREIATANVKALLAQHSSTSNADEAAESVLKGFEEVMPHDDVLPGIEQLTQGGFKVCTMTNGSKAVTKAFLERGNLQRLVSPTLDVEGPRCFKPGKGAYTYVAQQLGIEPSKIMLVAVHPWDCNGAKASGMQAAFISRAGQSYPGYFLEPEITAASFEDLAQQLLNTS